MQKLLSIKSSAHGLSLLRDSTTVMVVMILLVITAI